MTLSQIKQSIRQEPSEPETIGDILPEVLRDIEQRMEKDEQGLD